MAVSNMPAPRRRTADRDPRNHEMTEMRGTLAEHGVQLEKMNTALFAPDADNENGQRGLMTTARRLDIYMDAFCAVWNAAKRIVVATVSGLVGLGSVGKAFGWW